MAKFRTRARAIDMLGRQQIANISTAISELFKNSYDAYADNVEADYFRYNKLFVLRDDGIGMTESEFNERWLAIGTESKFGSEGGMDLPPVPEGKKRRKMMGEKGIGRLAISTIGPQVLVLSSAKRNGTQFPTVAAFLNWRIFEAPGIDLSEIEIPVIPYPVGTLPNRDETKTLVELFGENILRLKKQIPEKLLEQIRDDLHQFDFDPNETDEGLRTISIQGSDETANLSLLSGGSGTHFYILPAVDQLSSEIDESPEGGGSSPLTKTLMGFTNTMKLPTQVIGSPAMKASEGEIPIRTAFRDHLLPDSQDDLINSQNFFTADDFELTDHLVEGAFDNFGNFAGTVRVYKGDSLKYLAEKPKSITEKTACGSFSLKFGYVQGAQSESSLSKDEFSSINAKIEKLGGLYIYRDGIRVQPYGNYDNDYLGLELRRSKGAGYYFFSYRRLFGYVEVSKDGNPELAEKAGREGFIDNEAYKQFKRILVNLFIQLSADFFRTGGENLAGYKETKADLKKAEKIRRITENKNSETRKKLRRDLDRMIESLDSNEPQKAVSDVKDDFFRDLDNLQNDLFVQDFPKKILKLEKDFISRLRKTKDRYKLAKPNVGLDDRLTNAWEYYRNSYTLFESDVLATENEIAISTQAALKDRNAESEVRDWIVKNSLERQAEESAVLKKQIIDIKNSLTRLNHDIDKIAKDFHEEAKGLDDNLRQKLIKGTEKTFHEAFRAFSKDLEQLSASNQRTLSFISERVDELEQSFKEVETQNSIDERIAAWEEQNINLRRRYDENLDMAQLGMAVSVIGHEFSSSINDIRKAIDRLRNWATAVPELKVLYSDIRRGFDHLDEYLSMFTPLQKRLYRTKVEMRGAQIANYLRQVFAEPLNANSIRLETSDRFSKVSIKGYPSAFYPVFINLIDNAIYWLKDSSGDRTIKLDAERDGTISVSDTGPGIHGTDRDFVFDAGFTRKPGGRGLGLMIAKEILEKNEYELKLSDSTRRGTTFLIKPFQKNVKD